MMMRKSSCNRYKDKKWYRTGSSEVSHKKAKGNLMKGPIIYFPL